MISKSSVEVKTKELLNKCSITDAPIPVEQVAKKLGVEIRFSPLDEELSGMIFIKDGQAIIGVNSMHHPNRQRFTIAHELGHFILHKKHITSEIHVDKQFRVLMRDGKSATGTELIEIEANRFAASLLMPADLVAKALDEREFDIDDETPLMELAKQFKVSKQTMEYRIRNLGI